MSTPVPGLIKHVVIIVQENHTTDNYFRSLAAYGANVATNWPLAANPPAGDQPHDRRAYFEWLTHAITGEHMQFDTAVVLPYYLYLAITGAFLENHCSGFGTNSTPNHLFILGGQSPTLRNPTRRQPPPLWDMPSLPGLADDNGITWRVYAAAQNFPIGFYTQLQGSPNVVSSTQFLADVDADKLATLTFLYHNSPLDEHPPADVKQGMNTIRQAVDAVVKQGVWDDTVFMLTWDDWGGYDDHVATPVIEYTPDNVQLAFGPRVPLLMFGGHVGRAIDSRWCSHTSIPKTAIQLLGLPDLGVPRLDDDPGLADLVDANIVNPPPPAFGTKIALPPPPEPTPVGKPLPPPPTDAPQPVAEIVLRDGGTLPPPNDVPLPPQTKPPTNG
jgi:phospholipase C